MLRNHLISLSFQLAYIRFKKTPTIRRDLQLVQIWKNTHIPKPQDARIFAETKDKAVNNNNNTTKGKIARQVDIGNAYTDELNKPMGITTNPSINAYKHHIAYIARIRTTHPTPPTDDRIDDADDNR